MQRTVTVDVNILCIQCTRAAKITSVNKRTCSDVVTLCERRKLADKHAFALNNGEKLRRRSIEWKATR